MFTVESGAACSGSKARAGLYQQGEGSAGQFNREGMYFIFTKVAERRLAGREEELARQKEEEEAKLEMEVTFLSSGFLI